MDSFDFQFLFIISLGGFLGGAFLFWINNIDNDLDIIPPFHYDFSRNSPSPSCSSKRPRNSLAGNTQQHCQTSSKSSTSPRNDPLARDAFMIPPKPYRNIENIAARYRAAAYSSDPFAHGLLPSASSPKSFLHNAPPVPPFFQYVLSALIVVVIWEFLRYCLKSLKSRCTTCSHVSQKNRPTKEKQVDTPEITQSVVDSPLAFTTMPKHRRLVYEPRPSIDIPPSPTETLSRRQSGVRRTSIRSDLSGYQTARSRLSSSLSTQSAVTNSPFRSFPCITPPSPLKLKLKTKASLLPDTKDVFRVTTYNTHTASVNNTTHSDIANASAKSIDSNDISADVLNKNKNEIASMKIGSTQNSEAVNDIISTNPDKTFLVENPSGANTPRKESNSCASNNEPNITPTPVRVPVLPFQFKSSAKKIALSHTPSLSPATPLRATMLSSLSNSLDEKTIIPNALSPITPLHNSTAVLPHYFDLEKKTPTLNNTQSPKMLTPLPPFVVARKRRKLDNRRSSNESPPISTSPPTSPPSPSSPTSSPPVTHDQSPESSRLRAVLSPHSMSSPSPPSSLNSSPRLESLPMVSPGRTTSPLAPELNLFDSPNNRFTPIERTVLHDRHMNPSLLNEASLSLIRSISSAQSLNDMNANNSDETSPLPIPPSVTQKPKFTIYTGDEEEEEEEEEALKSWRSPPPVSLPVLPPRPKFSIYTGSDPSGASSSSTSSTSYSDDSSTRPLPGNDLQTLNENLLRRIKRIDRIRAKARGPDQDENEEEEENLKEGEPQKDDADADGGVERLKHLTQEEILIEKENLLRRIGTVVEERRKRRRMGLTPLAEVKEEESLRSSGSSILSNRPGRRVRFAESKNTVHVFEAVKADNTAYTPTLWALSTYPKTFYDEESGDEYTRELTREELIECEELDHSIRLELDDLRREMAEKGTIVYLRHHLGCTDLGLSPSKSGRVDFSFEASDNDDDEDEPVVDVSGVDLECCYEEEEGEEEEGLNS